MKAVEYFIKEKLSVLGFQPSTLNYVHFGLTSQDINNTAVPLSIKEALEEVLIPQLAELIKQLQTYADEWAEAWNETYYTSILSSL